ncbi:hypothetical protein [Pseudolabrys sp. FHR47]|uniref:hypothetical protein n=1 Tax=Pseudolabrys sp. FHR47 TaxID=2562284 RepID=UPI0010BE3710|nr:hypothetical protein [Pseudolabrys sp. FHR47]
MRTVCCAWHEGFQRARRVGAATLSTGLFRRRLSATVLLAAIALLSVLAPARSQDFQTGKVFVCANGIKSRTDACNEILPPFNNLDRRIFRNKRVDFKFTVFGRGEAFDNLQRKNYLPVRVAVWRDGIRKDDDIALDISQRDWDAYAEELSGQFAEDGQFAWRTFFHINLHDAKTISIEINNAQGRTVSGDGKPARVSLGFQN